MKEQATNNNTQRADAGGMPQEQPRADGGGNPAADRLRTRKNEIEQLLSRDSRLWQLKRFCPHSPFPKQLAFLMAQEREVFFGGAAGPGKTDALLMGALEFVHVPGYRALILRRTFPQLEEIMDRARMWLKNKRGVNWNGSKRQFDFECPTGDTAVIRFGYCDAEMDVANYDGFEYQYIAWDELTHFTEWQYTYLFSRLRSVLCPACEESKRKGKTKWPHLPLGHVPLRVRSASNPGNHGHDWVKERFKIGSLIGELKRLHPDRGFMPAVMSDNPALRAEEYKQSLMELQPVRRAQLLNGDWDVRAPGELFDRGDFQFIDDWPRDAVYVRAWDLAASPPTEANKDPDWTVGVKIGKMRQGKFFIIDVLRARRKSAEVEELMRATAEMDGREVSILIPQDPGSAGKSYAQHLQTQVLLGFNVIIEPQNGSKYVRAKPMSAAAKAQNLILLRADWNNDFIVECEQAGPNDKLYNHDDQWDAASFGFNYLCANSMEFGWQSGRTPGVASLDPRFDDDDVGREFGTMVKSRRWGPGAW